MLGCGCPIEQTKYINKDGTTDEQRYIEALEKTGKEIPEQGICECWCHRDGITCFC